MEDTKPTESSKRLSLKLGTEDEVNLTEEETSILLLSPQDAENNVDTVLTTEPHLEHSDQEESDAVHDFDNPQTIEEALEIIHMREKEALLAASTFIHQNKTRCLITLQKWARCCWIPTNSYPRRTKSYL